MMNTWNNYLPEQSKRVGNQLYQVVEKERNKGITIYPPQEDIFKALKLTKPEDVKIVIIGQDPYHEEGQANGLAFSVNPGVVIPHSLNNIFKELHNDIGCNIPTSGDLTKWAQRGILLLNTVLTVEEGSANSHSGLGWQSFVLDIIRSCLEMPQPIVFLLWGKQAKKIIEFWDISSYEKKDYYVTSHPSPLSATRGTMSVPAFIGSRPFSTANRLLKNMGGEPVNWSLDND